MRALLSGLALVLLTACGGAAITAVPPSPTPELATSAERGRALFVNKGCITCHVNTRAQRGPRQFTMDGPPNLSSYHNDPAFLRRWLADPQAVRPTTWMPNLKLSDAEIEHLIAFLNEAQ